MTQLLTECALVDDGNTDRRVNVRVTLEQNCLWIYPAGYGTAEMADSYGAPVALEVYDGRLRVIVWPDILDPNPTVIDLESAQELLREPEDK